MDNPPPDPRIHCQVRLRTSSVAAVDAIAARYDWDRATALRTLLAVGLDTWNREHPTPGP